jgi:DNA-binding FrmR family transcriptional regulator
MLENHLKGCVSEAIRDKGNDERLIDQVMISSANSAGKGAVT